MGQELVADSMQIMSVIPHRPPFLLIDGIWEVVPGKKVTARKCVTINEPFFPGHFPQKPVMPGVLIIEALAQAGAYAILSLEEFRGKIAFFGAIDKAKFRRNVVPGDVLRLEVEIMKLNSRGGTGKAVAFVEDKKAAEAELTFMIG